MESWPVRGGLQAFHDSTSEPRLSRKNPSQVIQYTYLLTLPLIMVYAMGFTVIKYQMGWTYIPNYGGASAGL